MTGPGSIEDDPRYLAAQELLTVGMNDAAALEISALQSRNAPDMDALLKISELFYGAGDFHRGLKAYRRYQIAVGNASFEEAGGAASRLAFPAEAVDMAMACMDTKKNNAPEIDPYLVAAVMREESEFNPGAVSRTGALGVMQIMPATGRLIASGMGRAFDEKDLFDPPTSIRFGSHYLGKLLKRFNGNVVLAVAAYNAGPAAVSGWTKTLPPEPDEFIESIPYSETRAYTKRVLRSYREYLRLAGKPVGASVTGNPLHEAVSASMNEKEGVGF